VSRASVVVDGADFPLETPVPTAPAHRFVGAAREGRGLAILAPGFFEYEWTPAGDLVLTLLRAVGELSRDDVPARPGHAAWPQATPLAQCLGPHRTQWAVLPLGAADLERGELVERAWEDVFLPLQGPWIPDARALGPIALEAALDGDGLVVSAIKPARVGAGLVLRCYNATAQRSAGAWRFSQGVRAAHRVRADERESQELMVENRGRTVRFVAEPHEIVSILVT
jgi:alpha-mannosidase